MSTADEPVGFGSEGLVSARERAITLALKLACTERDLPSGRAAKSISDLDQAFYLACRDLTNVIDDLPPGRRPRGWELEPEGRLA